MGAEILESVNHSIMRIPIRKTKICLVTIQQCWTEDRKSTAVAEDLRPTATVAEV